MRALLPLTVFLLGFSIAHAGLLSEVPAASREELASGQMVVESVTIPNMPWPKIIIFQVVNAPTTLIWNLFTDFAAAPSYTPGLISAQVLNTNSDGSKDVQYTIKAPIIQRASYIVRNSYLHHGSMYEVKWTLVKSPLAKTSDGSIRIEPYQKTKTLLCYTNLCVPISSLLNGLKGEALKEAKATVKAIATEAQRRAAAGPQS